MSLHAWDWEDEDVESMEPMGALSNFCQSMSECQVEECLSAKAQESESDQQYSSSRSPDGRASTFSSEVPQVVPCKFIISLAFPVNICPKGKCVRLVEKHKKHPKMDKPAAKGHHTYHIEYFLLPDDKEPEKVDLVVFPAVVKVLLDSGVKTVKPWHEGDKVWVSWTQNFDINVTKELLKKINFYKITLMLWDTTDKVSKKVRYFRLKKAGCLEDTESLGKSEVKRLVLNQRRPSEASIQVNEEWNQEYEPGKPEKAGKLLKPFHVKWKEAERGRKNQKKRKKYPAEEEADPKLADYWAQGAFSIQLAVMPLLAGWQTVRLCTPVYCRYQFHKAPVHQTEGQPHGSRVSFQDINVIFLGAIHPSDLREYLEGPPMVVEVHDRDRKSEEYSRKPTLFGEDPLDSYLNSQAFISPKETENNPFESQNKTWDPYGIARVSFADLLLGQKYLNLAVPIHSCESKPIHHGQDSRSRKVVGFRVPTDVLHCGPMPMGNYLEANSLLKLRVDIAVPLQAAAEGPEPDLADAQFGRIVFVFDSRKSFLLYSVLQDITMINARALDLDSYPMATIRQILSAFKVRVKIQERQDLDVLTGFHLLDGKTHLLILEGLADQGLKRLWESHQGRITKSEYRKHKVLYNSQLLFQHRLYADMDTILYHVHLFKPLSQLMKHMALYLHNSVMKKAFQTLTRIYYICHYTTKLREVITRDLLPSSAMIKDLSQKFGLPISLEELTDGNFVAMLPHPTSNLEDFRSRNSTLNYEILAHQEKYLQWRNVMMSRNKSQNHSLIQDGQEVLCAGLNHTKSTHS
ncbi:PREDICTED: uncharacterized protein KIAA1257 homolog [Miniopterus natalensis]|uniref:uncharacterized protein KIAA1257 homolog n=1 Tax=Miniopterus natalensis TaxID=291302 RepID=UPI0007A721C1|nr:PREDICTED: uncharacterized protein KIAA1257 homolog [Miniopterus natalensis]